MMRWLVVAFFALIPATGYSAPTWPVQKCSQDADWLEFAEMRFCLGKPQILSFNVLNLSSPSLVIHFRNEGGEVREMSLIRLEDEEIAGGLHTRFGGSPRAVFELLAGTGGEVTNEKRIAGQVLGVDEHTVIRRYADLGGLAAYVLIQAPPKHSAIYLFQERRAGAISISGELTAADVESVLSHVRW